MDLLLTVLKTSSFENNTRQITCRDYKMFDSLKFNNELKNFFPKENIDNCTKLNEKFLEVFDKSLPLKRKLLKTNHVPYVSKSLRKTIMRRSDLEKAYFENYSQKSLKGLKKQKKLCSRLYKKGRNFFCNNLNSSFVKITDFFGRLVSLFS